MWYIVSIALEWTFTLLLFLIWFLVVCLCLIVRVWVNYPRSKAMWITTGLTLVFIVLAIVFALIERGQGQVASVFGGLAECSFLVTAATAKVIEIANTATFLPQPETPVVAVLHRGWWHMEVL